jgi:hypothetical protein
MAYYMPCLVRLAFAPPESGHGGTPELLFILYSGFAENTLYKYCSAQQRRAVASFPLATLSKLKLSASSRTVLAMNSFAHTSCGMVPNLAVNRTRRYTPSCSLASTRRAYLNR